MAENYYENFLKPESPRTYVSLSIYDNKICIFWDIPAVSPYLFLLPIPKQICRLFQFVPATLKQSSVTLAIRTIQCEVLHLMRTLDDVERSATNTYNSLLLSKLGTKRLLVKTFMLTGRHKGQ